ncbi:MAG: iron-containing alcohol dehydrogenase [Acidobacteria bacterium]|nr:iron-containing alcohol dehydrogenase [Acidobacteriota bacterium]
MSQSANDTAFHIMASNCRFGRGITHEVGMDLVDLGAERVLVVIDPALRSLPTGAIVQQSLEDSRLEFDVFDGVEVEPTDASFMAASAFATEGRFDAIVAVGGGSTIDTAKAANVYATYPADFLDYVNPSIGRQRAVPGPLKPLIAIPTTAGTGSETTGVAVFDYTPLRVKTGIASKFMRPTMGIVDWDNTHTQPAAVAASAGLDVLSHALESVTALPYDQRLRPPRPSMRAAYQGANPMSDVWAMRALEIVAEFLPRAVADANDVDARMQMILAASMAGIGFGNAGVHLPHAMAYPVAGMVRGFRPDGYATRHPLVPHGMSVILQTPAVARFTAPTSPQRHLLAAKALGADISHASPADAGPVLSDRVMHFMQTLRMPRGLKAVGYSLSDLPALVDGTLAQQRLLGLSPRPAAADDLAKLFEESMVLW